MEQKNLDPLQPKRQEEEQAFQEFISPQPDEINPNRLSPEEPERKYTPELEPTRREHEKDPIRPLEPMEPLQPERTQPYGPSEPGQQPAEGYTSEGPEMA